MHLIKRSIIPLLVIAMLISLISPGCGVQDRIQHLTYDLHYEPDSFDPAKTANQSGKELANALFEGLVRLKPDGTYEKAMAVDWTVENEGKKYTFRLRDASWANGNKITAHDFVFAWQRALSPASPSPYAYLLYGIKNAEGYNRSEDEEYYGDTASLAEVAIKALDEHTLDVELEEPDYAFYKRLAHPVFFPLPQSLIGEKGEEFFTAGNIVGNGPYLLASHEPGSKYLLRKNNSYWDKDSVALESMAWLVEGEERDNWQLFQRGDIDLSLYVPQEQMADGLKKGQVLTSPLLANCYLQVNTTEKPLRDKSVRMALSSALDREKMVNEVLEGGQKPALGLIPHGLAGNENSPVVDNDSEKARRLLAEAGYPSRQDFPAIDLLIEETEAHLYLAEFIRMEWQEKLGISVNIVPLPWEEKVKAIQARKYDVALQGWSVEYNETGSFLDRFVFRLGRNETGWFDTGFDEQMGKAKTAADEKTRLESLRLAEKILLTDLPVIPLFDFTRTYAIASKVKGVYLPAAGAATEFKWAYIAQPAE